MKKGFFVIGLCLCLSVIWWATQKKENEWQTFTKDEQSTIHNYPTTKNEKKIAKIDLPKKEEVKRSPAAKSPTQKKVKKNQRKSFLHQDQKKLRNAQALNNPHKDWKKRMGPEVLRFMRPETKLFLKHLESLTIYKRGRPLHVEKVLIKMTSPEGRLYSYNALVDSESGKVLETWNRTIHESLGEEKPFRMKFTN